MRFCWGSRSSRHSQETPDLCRAWEESKESKESKCKLYESESNMCELWTEFEIWETGQLHPASTCAASLRCVTWRGEECSKDPQVLKESQKSFFFAFITFMALCFTDFVIFVSSEATVSQFAQGLICGYTLCRRYQRYISKISYEYHGVTEYHGVMFYKILHRLHYFSGHHLAACTWSCRSRPWQGTWQLGESSWRPGKSSASSAEIHRQWQPQEQKRHGVSMPIITPCTFLFNGMLGFSKNGLWRWTMSCFTTPCFRFFKEPVWSLCISLILQTHVLTFSLYLGGEDKGYVLSASAGWGQESTPCCVWFLPELLFLNFFFTANAELLWRRVIQSAMKAWLFTLLSFWADRFGSI